LKGHGYQVSGDLVNTFFDPRTNSSFIHREKHVLQVGNWGPCPGIHSPIKGNSNAKLVFRSQQIALQDHRIA
jgi:hypothetical protein